MSEDMFSPNNIPLLFESKEDCCGCSACYAICPRNAITMKPDIDGFEYPCIDMERCIFCNLCLKVCPIKRKTISPS